MIGTSGDSGPAVNAVIWILFALAVIAIVVRFDARARHNRSFGWDDYVMGFSLLLNLVSCICTSIAIHHGVGKHFNALTPEQTPSAILWGLIAVDTGIMSDTMPKMAVALLINKVLAPSPLMRCFIITVAVVLNCLGVFLVVLSFEQCQPIAYQWEKQTVLGSCLSPNVFVDCSIAVGYYSSSIDLFFSVYPLIIVSRLNMKLRKKVTIMVIFSLSLLILFTTLYKTAAELPKLRYTKADFTWLIAQVILWTSVEGSVIIIAGSIPTWGWVFRAEQFQSFITWILVSSQRRTRISERLSSNGGEVDKRSDGLGPKDGHDSGEEEQDGSVALQSIDRIERMACS